MQIRIYYEDTDAGGIVYHSNYLNFCERARSDIFFNKGHSPILEDGHFVARKLEARYLQSAKLGDLLDIHTNLTKVKKASFILSQFVYRGKEKIFSMDIELVFISFDSKPQSLGKKNSSMLLNLFNDI